MKKFVTKMLVCLLTLSLMPWQGFVSLHMPSAHAQEATGIVVDEEDNTVTVEEPEDEPEDLGDDDIYDKPAPPKEALTLWTQNLDEIESHRMEHRDGEIGHTIEFTFPSLGMSQCDMQLIRSGKIDERLLNSLNYLVTDSNLGGAGMSYLHVTFAQQCEESVPELVGGAYPVEFVDDSPQPKPPVNPPERNNDAGLPDGSGQQNSFLFPNTTTRYAATGLGKLISSVEAAVTKAADVEPSGAQTIHDNGQAVDIVAAGLAMCTTKSGGVLGVGSKLSRSPPRPLKVAWQTDAGVSNIQTPFGNYFDQMSQTAGLDQFLEGFSSQDGTFRAQALNGAFTMMGFNLLANLTGVKPGSFDAQSAALNYQTLGYALLADTMKLPDASVFNPFISADDKVANPFASTHNNLEILWYNGGLRAVEQGLKLPAYSLDGTNYSEVLANTGRRALEKQFGLTAGTLRSDWKNPDEFMKAVGQAKMDTYFRLPAGTSSIRQVNNQPAQALVDNLAAILHLPSESKLYADRLIKGALHLPAETKLEDIAKKEFWAKKENEPIKKQLAEIDQQLFPVEQYKHTDVTDFFDVDTEAGKTYNTIVNNRSDSLTERMLTGELSFDDYERILGAGALFTEASYSNPARAFDLPPDESPVIQLSDGTAFSIPDGYIPYTYMQYLDIPYQEQQKAKVIPQQKNNFLKNIVEGNKNYLVALGTNTLAKTLGMHPDERYRIEQVAQHSNLIGRAGATVVRNQLTGMVGDAIQGNFNKVRFTGAKATMATPLTPQELFSSLGSFLATDATSKDAGRKAEQRFNSLVQIAKTRYGNMLENATQNTLGDPLLLSYLYQYDRSRPDTKPTTETFLANGDGQTTFRLSNFSTSLTKITLSGEAGEQEIQGRIGSDNQSIVLNQDDAYRAAGGDSIRVTYVARARKAGQPSQLAPDTFYSLMNDPKALNTLALQFGAAKVSTSLKLAPNALAFAANLINPSNKSGVTGIGQATLEQAAGMATGSLANKSIKDLSRAQLIQMFRLEPEWYDPIKRNDEDFWYYNNVNVYDTDAYYHVEYGSTQQLLQGEITLEQFEKRMGQAQLKYNTGSILASQFSIHVAGYRLNQNDFYDLINGSYYTVMQRVGARLQEKNRGLPIGALANSLITGERDVSLYALGTNVVASTFHLNQIDLTHATSLADVKQQIGLSTLEQNLGFKTGTWKGEGALDIAKSVGAENFLIAFGITVPISVRQEMDQFRSNFRPELVQQRRDEVAYQYLTGIIGPGIAAETHFSDATTKRFEAIDAIHKLTRGTTLQLMQYQVTPSDYSSKISVQAVDSRVKAGVAELLGIDAAYLINTEDMVKKLTDKSKENDPVAYKSFFALVQQAGGLNFDALLSWDKGTFGHLIENFNDSREVKRTIVAQGTKQLARFAGLQNGYLQGIDLALSNGKIADFESAVHFIGDASIAQTVNVPGFTETDAHYLTSGRFADGLMMIGTAYMAKSEDMKRAGITFQELKLSIFGDPTQETNYIFTKIREEHPELANLGNDQELLGLRATEAGQSYLEISKRSFMNEARQSISYKFMDYEVRRLLPDVAIPVGFARAMVGGSYIFSENGQTVKLTGDDARRRMGQLFIIEYAKSHNDILRGIPDQYLVAVTDFLQDQDSRKLQDRLSLNNDAGFRAIGSSLDPIFSKVFGTQLAPGTSGALLAYASNGDATQFQRNIWNTWQYQALSFADRALGFKPGTASVMYQGIVGYQTALKSYSNTVGIVAAITDDAKATYTILRGGKEVVVSAQEARSAATNAASRQLKTQTAMIIATVANFVFQKQITQVESALGLAPGTLMYLIQYLIHPDPISLGLFIFFNFFWGGSSTTCGVDYYPRPGGRSTSNIVAKQAEDRARAMGIPIKPKKAKPAPYDLGHVPPAVSALRATIDDSTTAADDDVLNKLLPPANFNGQSNESYRKGLKAGAQYEVRRVIGSLELMALKNPDQKLIQIGTFSVDDVNLFEKISTQIYGPLQGRSKAGPGWNEKTTDRIHLGV